MIQNIRTRKKEDGEDTNQSNTETAGSPVRTVLGSLVAGKARAGSANKSYSRNGTSLDPRKPVRVEDVPFRRQDRRILNARNRRLMDRKLILFIILLGLLLLSLGAGCLGLYFVFQNERNFKPFIIIGPVLLGGGLITWLCSIEICIRLHLSNKRLGDPEIDNLVNPHEVKHWIDPNIIPYGWGLFREEDQVKVEDKGEEKPGVAGVGELLNSPSSSTTSSQVALQMEDMLGDFPHRIMAQAEKDNSSFNQEDLPGRCRSDPLLSSEIFSTSLRYSHVSRPHFHIDCSSPLPQLRGEFIDEEEKIANLFKVSRSSTPSRSRPGTS